MTRLELHPDRLLPAEANARAAAREIYAATADLPIISPHGHVPISWLADNTRFSDPTSLLITPDHYVNRLLHASGVKLETLGVGVKETDFDPAARREAFRTVCRNWHIFAGTPMRYWFEDVLVRVFGISENPSDASADAIYDRIDAALKTDEFLPRALMERFRIDFIATTDDPCDDLAGHAKIAADKDVKWRVAPTFRPDRYLEPGRPDWADLVWNLGEAAGIDTSSLSGYTAAMENRRAYFKEHGAVSTDHSHFSAATVKLDDAEAARIYAAALAGRASRAETTALQQHLLHDQARMACEDGLVMTLHPAVIRNHHAQTLRRYGADVGGDIPAGVEFAKALQPLLNDFGTNPNFHLVVFTIDETVYSRELAPLAGFYPSLYLGAPWWFIDEPDAITRYRSAITGATGFTRCSGFIDDTRAFLSIPARHDMARRLDAGFLGRLVAEHRLNLAEATEIGVNLVDRQPRTVFKLGD